jgi:hypothetical protein
MYTTMRERMERKQRRWAKFNGAINIVGYIAGGLAISGLIYVLAFGMDTPVLDECAGNEEQCDVLEDAEDDNCSADNEGTDYWYEVCKDGGEVEL